MLFEGGLVIDSVVAGGTTVTAKSVWRSLQVGRAVRFTVDIPGWAPTHGTPMAEAASGIGTPYVNNMTWLQPLPSVRLLVSWKKL